MVHQSTPIVSQKIRGVAEFWIDSERQIADRAVWSEVVVVVLPVGESDTSVSERCEKRLIEQLIAQLQTVIALTGQR